MSTQTTDPGIEQRDRVTRRSAASPEGVAIRRLLLRHALRADDLTVSANDVRADAYQLYPGIDARTIGGAILTLSLAGLIGRASTTRSTEPAAHGRPLQVWRLTDQHRAAAELAKLEGRP